MVEIYLSRAGDLGGGPGVHDDLLNEVDGVERFINNRLKRNSLAAPKANVAGNYDFWLRVDDAVPQGRRGPIRHRPPSELRRYERMPAWKSRLQWSAACR